MNASRRLLIRRRKVGQVLFNPAAENILASASGDCTIKLWDVGSGKSSLTLKHNDIVQSLSWNATGTMMVTTSRDKKLRFWDARQEKAVHTVAGHSGAKNSRVVWMGEHNRVVTTGFSKMSDRQMALWDVGSPAEPIGGFTVLDSISGVCMPFWGRAQSIYDTIFADELQTMELSACILPVKEMAISDTSSTRMTNSNSYPNTSLEILNEVSLSCQGVEST